MGLLKRATAQREIRERLLTPLLNMSLLGTNHDYGLDTASDATVTLSTTGMTFELLNTISSDRESIDARK